MRLCRIRRVGMFSLQMSWRNGKLCRLKACVRSGISTGVSLPNLINFYNLELSSAPPHSLLFARTRPSRKCLLSPILSLTVPSRTVSTNKITLSSPYNKVTLSEHFKHSVDLVMSFSYLTIKFSYNFNINWKLTYLCLAQSMRIMNLYLRSSVWRNIYKMSSS